MQEICQSGSEGGAKLTFVPTPIKVHLNIAGHQELAKMLLPEVIAALNR